MKKQIIKFFEDFVNEDFIECSEGLGGPYHYCKYCDQEIYGKDLEKCSHLASCKREKAKKFLEYLKKEEI